MLGICARPCRGGLGPSGSGEGRYDLVECPSERASDVVGCVLVGKVTHGRYTSAQIGVGCLASRRISMLVCPSSSGGARFSSSLWLVFARFGWLFFAGAVWAWPPFADAVWTIRCLCCWLLPFLFSVLIIW